MDWSVCIQHVLRSGSVERRSGWTPAGCRDAVSARHERSEVGKIHQVQWLLINDLVAQHPNHSNLILVQQDEVPFRERHANRHLGPSFLVVVLSVELVVERRGEMCWRRRLSRIRYERCRFDDAVAGMEVVDGGRRKSEGAVVDAGSCMGASHV